jgi:sialidase-1
MSDIPAQQPLDYFVCTNTPWNGRNCEPSAIQLRDGRLLLIWSCWTTGSGADHEQAEIRAKISEDMGATWSDSFFWQGRGHYRAVEDSALAWLPSGKLGMTYMARLAELHEGQEWVHQAILSFFRKSDDGGQTWSEPRLMNPTGVNITVPWWDRLRVSQSGRLITAATSWWRDLCFQDRDQQDRSNVYALFSDDEGESWNHSNGISIEYGTDYKDSSEASIEQFSDGQWIMTLRNPTGRAFKSYSADDGETWSRPEPAALASSNSPVVVRRIPGTNDLLTIWNQASNAEIRNGHNRHRLSTAISSDKGNTWRHFRNLESQDTCTRIELEPPSVTPLARKEDLPEHWPSLRQDETTFELTGSKYINCSYPSVLFFDDLALIAYDASGHGVESGLKLRRMPVSWFYDS